MIGACTVCCGCPITMEEVEELQYKCGDAAAHKPEEGSHPKRGRDEPKHSEVFLVERRILRERERKRINDYRGSFYFGIACCHCIKCWATALSATLMRK